MLLENFFIIINNIHFRIDNTGIYHVIRFGNWRKSFNPRIEFCVMEHFGFTSWKKRKKMTVEKMSSSACLSSKSVHAKHEDDKRLVRQWMLRETFPEENGTEDDWQSRLILLNCIYNNFRWVVCVVLELTSICRTSRLDSVVRNFCWSRGVGKVPSLNLSPVSAAFPIL